MAVGIIYALFTVIGYPWVMFKVSKFSLSRLSSACTAFVCAGFLANAILTDNGGDAGSQEQWRDGRKNAHSFVDRLGRDNITEWQSERSTVDLQTTGSISKDGEANKAPQPVGRQSEPSVLSLIRQNADVAPAVSSGTDRVSVIVKSGDTLFGIARRHGLTVTDLARLNSLDEPYVIKIGQTLYVAR